MRNKKILIVDDSEMNRELLKDILDRSYNVEEAEDGEAAIELISENSDNYSLVLLDIMMPKKDGFEVLEYINKNRYNDKFAIIMISADDSPMNIRKAYDLGAFDYISRPFDPAVVKRRIANALIIYERQERLEDIITQQFKRQEQYNHVMIAILSHIVEFRNGESGAHVFRVNEITEFLLKELVGLSDKYYMSQQYISMVSLAASLHDIGKILIPKSILNKPGRLTDEEFEIMKTHTTVGGDILKDIAKAHKEIPLIETAYEICRWHHERYDGRGYPDGLVGDDIPVSAQVVALADVYDALTSDRCYKKAFSHEKAVEMILNGECGVFNPDLIKCFVELSDKLGSELDEYTEEKIAGLDNIKLSINFDELFIKED